MRDARSGFSLLSFAILASLSLVASCWAGTPPETGSQLPEIRLPTPALPEDAAYLGVSGETFALKAVECQVLLVEIIGVYCPHCYKQAPHFNNLFDRLQRGKLKGKVKMLGVAAGGTPNEVKYLREKGQYKYPIVADESYAVHKLLNEPRTPFTMLLNLDGKVLYSHQGPMAEVDSFYETIKKLAE